MDRRSGILASETRVRSGPVRSVVAGLRPDHRAAYPFAADSSEPGRPQAVKADAVAPPPLRGFGLDGLTPPRFGLPKQTKADWGRTALPNPDRYACTNHVLGNGCDNARAVDRKALESRVLTRLRERMMTSPPPACVPICKKPIGSPASPTLIGIHPPRACRNC